MKSLKEMKIKELIVKNFPLKILAVIIAVVIWIVIVNIDNPSQRKTISGITVNLTNEETLTDKGYIYQIESGSVISIVVKAPQTIVEELKASDFYAYADLSERSPESDTAKIYVTCTNESIANQVDIVSQKLDFVQLSIDNKVDKDLPVEVVISGTPEEGYVVGDYSTSPTTIKVSGAEATVSRIVSAKLHYNVDRLTADVADSVVPVFYDADGKEVNSDKLELSRNDIKLTIDILPIKWITVNFAVTGTPADGYELTGYDSNFTSICIAGSKDDLAKISSIDIPAGILDVTDAVESKEFTVNLGNYLSSEYRITSSTSDLIVTADIEKVSDGIVNIDYNDIEIKGTDEALTYELLPGEDGKFLSVGISGIANIIQNLTGQELNASIDLEGKKVGTYNVKVSFISSDSYSISGSYFIKVTITDQNALEDESSETLKDDTEETTAEE